MADDPVETLLNITKEQEQELSAKVSTLIEALADPIDGAETAKDKVLLVLIQNFLAVIEIERNRVPDAGDDHPAVRLYQYALGAVAMALSPDIQVATLVTLLGQGMEIFGWGEEVDRCRAEMEEATVGMDVVKSIMESFGSPIKGVAMVPPGLDFPSDIEHCGTAKNYILAGQLGNLRAFCKSCGEEIELTEDQSREINELSKVMDTPDGEA